MSENQVFILIFGMCLAFCIGVKFGAWAADRQWRSKGDPDATRMASGGHLYRVTRDE